VTRVAAVIPLAALALVLAACGEGGGAGAGIVKAKAKPSCLDRTGWQKLANSIHAPVYCPGWMPDPLDGVVGGRWNNINSVSKDRSYLIGFIWFERGSGELHVNLRGYPGRTSIPRCPGDIRGSMVPCFADPHGHIHENGIDATVYTVNQGADQWHVLLAWHRHGSLYSLSQHVAAPLTYGGVVADLKRMLRTLSLVQPARS
jgi:hypothetical protein